MKNLFVVICSVVLVWTVVLFTPSISHIAMGAEEKEPVDVGEVAVEKVKEDTFRITAKGVVRTSGWKVNLEPGAKIPESETQPIYAMGIKPTGVTMQVITPWEASVEMNLTKEIKYVSVKGKSLEGNDQAITKPVPW